MKLTDEEILAIAGEHCEFSGEGTYHLRRYPGAWAIVKVVRECFELAELVQQATAWTPRPDFSGLPSCPGSTPPGTGPADPTSPNEQPASSGPA